MNLYELRKINNNDFDYKSMSILLFKTKLLYLSNKQRLKVINALGENWFEIDWFSIAYYDFHNDLSNIIINITKIV